MTGATSRLDARRLLVVVTGLPGTGKSSLADAAGDALGAVVPGHDWAMSALRPYGELEAVLDEMPGNAHRDVAWSIVLALARSELRRNRCVVLDGVARAPQLAQCRAVALEERARCSVVLATCEDERLHRTRIEGRQRAIPNWYELDWEHVLAARARWQQPDDVDLVLEASHEIHANLARVVEHCTGAAAHPGAQSARRAGDLQPS